MTKEDIIRMAQEAGGYVRELAMGDAWLFTEDEYLERFAALVASAEREACAKIGDDHPSWSSRMYSATIRARGQV